MPRFGGATLTIIIFQRVGTFFSFFCETINQVFVSALCQTLIRPYVSRMFFRLARRRDFFSGAALTG